MPMLMTDNDRDGFDAARDEFAHNQAIDTFAEEAGSILTAMLAELTVTHPLLRDRRNTEFAEEFRGNRETLELMTGEDWPKTIGDFLAKCDARVRGTELVAA